MKRFFVICTLLLCLALSAVLFASCDLTPDENGDETTAPTHEHVWDEGTFTPGRCDAATKETVENGKIEYTCTVCGATKTEETDGHTWDKGKVIDGATCAQAGQMLYSCTVCNAKKTEKIPINPDAHTTTGAVERLVVPPTSTANGTIEKICANCGKGVASSTITLADYNTQVNAIKTQVNAFKIADFGGSNITTNLSAAAGKTYDATPVKPKAQHPRVMFNASEVAAVRNTIYEKNNSAAIKLFLNAVVSKPTTGKLPASSAHNNFSSDVLDGIQALALDYRMTGNKISGYRAILALKNHLTTMDFAGITGDPERQYGLTMFVSACVYDWCHDLLTTTDKQQIVSGVEHKCCDDGKMEMGFPPSGQYSVAGHGCEFQLLRDYLAFAIAIYDEYPGWWNYIGGRFYAEYVEPRNYYYGAGMVTQGASLYIRIRFSSDLYSAILIKAATGVMPYDAEGMKQVMRTVYTYELPGQNAFASGDDHVDDGKFVEYSRNTLLSSYLFEDATMRANLEYYKRSYSRFDSYYTVGSNYVEYLICSSNKVKAASNRHQNMPLILYNGGFLGQIIARNNWNDNQAAVLMKIGVRTGGNHDHRDAGQFQIWYKAMLAGDTGDYDSYGTNHWRNYHQATIAHNCILIGGNGQKRMGGNEMSHRNYLTDSNTLIGEVTGHEEGFAADGKTPVYAYIAGNNANAYGSDVATEVTRRMLAVYDTGNVNVPMYFFVFDNITSASSSAKKTFLLHVPAQPTINDKTVTVSKSGGKLVLQNVIGGNTITSVGGSGHNYDVDGTQCISRDDNNNVITSDDGFWGRVEITTGSGSKTNQLLNVMYVCDAEKNPAGQTATAISGNSYVSGAVIGKVAAVFVNSAERRSTVLSFTASGTGDLTYYVSGVKAGKWVVRDANGNSKRYTVEEDSGLLVFTAPAGQVTLTPQQ